MSEIRAYLPLMFWPDSDGAEGAALRDPGAIVVHESESDDENVVILSLTGLVDDFVSGLVNQVSGRVEGYNESVAASRLSSHLKELAAKIDTVMTVPVPAA